MPFYGESILGRPSIAAGNLLAEGPGAAARSIFAPSTLTPGERQTPAERTGQTGFVGGVLNAVTDPILLLAALTSFRFPIPRSIRVVTKGGKKSVENMFAVSEKLGVENKKLGKYLHHFRSAHSNFAGTKIPEIMDDLVATRVAFLDDYLPRFGDAIRRFEKTAGRPFTTKDQILVHAALEGLNKRGPAGHRNIGPLLVGLPKDKAFEGLVKNWRHLYDNMHKDIFKDKAAVSAIKDALSATQNWEASKLDKLSKDMGMPVGLLRKLRGKSKKDLKAFDESDLSEYFKQQPDYAPHYPVKDMKAHMEQFEATIQSKLKEELALTGREAVDSARANAMMREVFDSAIKRKGRMLPALKDLDAIKDYVNPKAYARLQKKLELSSGGDKPLLQYSMRIADSTSTYAHTAASTVAWTVKGNGGKMMDELVYLSSGGPGGQPVDAVRAKILKDTYIPQLMGKMTYEEAKGAQLAAAQLTKWHDWLDGDSAKKFLPEKVRKSVQGLMMDDRGNFRTAPLNRSIAGYLYTSALGLNPVAAARNLFQLALTTGPILGAKYTGIGLMNAQKKAKKYFQYRYGSKSMPHAEAYRKAFPEYHAAGIPSSPIVDEAIGRSLNNTYEHLSSTGMARGKSATQKVQKAMLGMFSLSEQTVRLSTFEGALAKGRADFKRSIKETGYKATPQEIQQEAMKMARTTVQETQFISGPSNTPLIFMNEPFSNPLARQFGQFTTRYAEFLSSTALRVGSAQREGGLIPGTKGSGRNWGTLAKAYIWSDLIYEMGVNAFDVDMSRSLMPGAMPAPSGHGPLGVAPFAPPAFSILAAATQDLSSGDPGFEEMQKVLPLFMPGGVGLARGVGMIPGGQGAAQALNKKWVDYDSQGPDGRYPMYSGKGTLVGYFDPFEIMLAGTGLMEKGAAIQSVQGLQKWLLSNREQIWQYKRDYRRAVYDGDMSKAKKIDTEFQQRLGSGSIRRFISKQDMENEKKKRELTGLEKIADTLPPEIRQQYLEAISLALQNVGGDALLGMQPGGITSGATAKARTPSRAANIQPPNYKQQMSPLGDLNTGSVSFSPNRMDGAFNGFAGFTP